MRGPIDATDEQTVTRTAAVLAEARADWQQLRDPQAEERMTLEELHERRDRAAARLGLTGPTVTMADLMEAARRIAEAKGQAR